jgi:hypothetical protein
MGRDECEYHTFRRSIPSRPHQLIHTQVWPRHRGENPSLNRHVGPGVEMREDPVEKRRRRGEIDPDLQDMASLE